MSPFKKPHMRRPGAFLAALTAFLCLIFPFPPVFAEEERPDLELFPESSILLCRSDSPEIPVEGLEKAPDETAYPASITKMLTALVALEQGDLEDLVTISAHTVDLSRVNSKIGVKEGEVYTLQDLLYGMLLPSGCDAARAIAEHIGGSEEAFADLMNEKAYALGMVNSHFANASGLHDENQYTTARDLARLGAAAAENAALCEILQTSSYEIREQTTGRILTVRNINRLITDPKPSEEYEKVTALYSWCIGGKTGSTNASGRTYLAMARKNGITLICVLLGDKVSTKGLTDRAYDEVQANRFLEAVSLFEYGFARLMPEVSIADLVSRGLAARFTVEVQDGDGTRILTCVPKTEGDILYPLPRAACEAPETIAAQVEPYDLTAPVQAGEQVGSVSYYYEETLLFTLPLLAETSLLPTPTASPVPEIQVESVSAPPAPVPSPASQDTAQKPAGSLLVWVPLVLLLLGTGIFILLAGRRRNVHPKKK